MLRLMLRLLSADSQAVPSQATQHGLQDLGFGAAEQRSIDEQRSLNSSCLKDCGVISSRTGAYILMCLFVCLA